MLPRFREFRMRGRLMRFFASCRLLAGISVLLTGSMAMPVMAAEDEALLSIDSFVPITSTVPSMKGQPAQIYVREVAKPATVSGAASGEDRVVLFVHGAGTPAEVAFDVPYQDYSWMAYLARAGFDVFS